MTSLTRKLLLQKFYLKSKIQESQLRRRWFLERSWFLETILSFLNKTPVF